MKFTVLAHGLAESIAARLAKVSFFFKQNTSVKRRWLAGAALLALFAASLVFIAGSRPGRYVAHEWGTFTSVAGGDGVLLEWCPLKTTELPKFVYNWNHAGLNRQPAGALAPSKSVMTTLQRMETPVIYFYADQEMSVDVSVRFPQGFITEWYPQAAQIGPSYVPASPGLARFDGYAHKIGFSQNFTLASFLPSKNVKDSRVHWAHIDLLPARDHQDLQQLLPKDRSGNHYFAARETDSDYLQTSSLSATNPVVEHEKFIFYRGVGNFAAPLQVTVKDEQSVVIANIGEEPLDDLFVVQQRDGAGQVIHLDHLAAGTQRIVPLDSAKDNMPVPLLTQKLGQQMALALEKAGLYRRESQAMVKTWDKSWFQEDGVRVLYLLPRAWTDRTLQVELEPAPRDLVRVMVGRAEVLMPELTRELTQNLQKATLGDPHAREAALAEFRKLGRFGEPAARLITKGASPEVSELANSLLNSAALKPVERASAF